MAQVSRRTLLAAGAATVVAANGLRWATADASTTGPAGDLPDDPFTLGVCAGDPDASSAVLWTRLTAVDGAVAAGGRRGRHVGAGERPRLLRAGRVR